MIPRTTNTCSSNKINEELKQNKNLFELIDFLNKIKYLIIEEKLILDKNSEQETEENNDIQTIRIMLYWVKYVRMRVYSDLYTA